MDLTPRDQDQVEGRGRTLEEVRDWTNCFHALVMDQSHHRRQLDLHSQAQASILSWRDGVIGIDLGFVAQLEDRSAQLRKAGLRLSCQLSDKLLPVVEVVAPELVEALVTAGECLNRLRRADGTAEVQDVRKAVSELYLLLAQTPETLPEAAQAREPEPAKQKPPMAPGSRGRPNVSGLCIEEFRRRAERGETLPSCAAESRALERWMLEVHPDESVSARTIANVIASEYRDLKRDLE